MDTTNVWQSIKSECETEINSYLGYQFESGQVDKFIYEKAISSVGVFANLNRWMASTEIDRISPSARRGIVSALLAERYADIAEAFFTDVEFGTGGIRGRAVIADWELELLREEGIRAPFLRGPNTINDLVLLQKSAAVAQFARDRNFASCVIGYDSRIRGKDFAQIIAELFLYYGFRVFLFDDVVPYPEVTFAIPAMKADFGILISASHNDRRYNGYKLSCGNGSQFSIQDRKIILTQYIDRIGFEQVLQKPLSEASSDQLVFLGGSKRLNSVNYQNYTARPVDMHGQHFRQVKKFILDPKLIEKQGQRMHIAFSAYNGAGHDAVPRLIKALKIEKLDNIKSLFDIDGMFPAFEDLKTPKGKKVYQQPDPGDKFAAKKAAEEYLQEFGARRWGQVDMLIGTDPDADRVGVTVKVPKSDLKVYAGEENVLLDADTAWSILLWYRIEKLKRMGADLSSFFLVQSHTTTDVLTLLVEKYGIAWVKTWVGFAQLAHATQMVWYGQSISREVYQTIYDFKGLTEKSIDNIAALEQSNGFSILGKKPPHEMALGVDGHVRDKDGTFAGILMLEVLAYAKSVGKSILQLVNEKLYLDPAIGLIRTGYRPAPVYGQYEGLQGRSRKLAILNAAEELMKRLGERKKVTIGGLRVSHTEVYKTGKYDVQHGYVEGYNPNDSKTFRFPDEGIRFFFGDYYNHMTVRPSGTSQSLRFHVQLRDPKVTRQNLTRKRIAMESQITRLFEDIGLKLGVDWDE